MNPSDYLVCELIDNVPLASIYGKHDRYSTLPYCAGSSRNTTPIIVDGLIFNAFRNLERALDRARERFSVTSNELLIWVDQVCIDQSDNVEKASQVAMMKEVF